MELPNLGKHCSVRECKQLDFLPVRCDACKKTFCKDHFTYNAHSCTESYKKDNQVPVCPLCNIPIPIMKGESPDVKVGQHIDTDCQSDPAKEKRKIYKNRCAVKGCKQKELVPVRCDNCHKNFCLKHRHEQDHKCQGFQDSGRGVSHAGAAAVNRFQGSNNKKGPFKTGGSSRPQQTPLSGMGKDLDRERRQRQPGGQVTSAYQSGMTEDEAMARAMSLSMQETNTTSQSQNTQPTTSQEDEDLALARALQQSEEEAAGTRRRPTATQRQSSMKDKCTMS